MIRLISMCLLLMTGISAYAQEDMLVSRSLGKQVQDDSINLTAEVRKQNPVATRISDQNQSRGLTATQTRDRQNAITNRDDQNFLIYDADVSLLADIDGDGYHHAINLWFDVDVSYDSATVYAKLYLSRDGGPWSQYHTTQWFDIHGDNFDDAWEVTTELLGGYPPGYYDILIEVFSLSHPYMVTSQVLDHHYLGKDIMLEDLNRDEIYVEETVYYSYGTGSFSLIWLLLLIQVVIAARGAATLTPEK